MANGEAFHATTVLPIRVPEPGYVNVGIRGLAVPITPGLALLAKADLKGLLTI